MNENRTPALANRLRPRALGALTAIAALMVVPSAWAETITVWSGYPELAPFYEHVAEGMREEFPDLTVKVEAIPVREHERRIALGLTSGSSGPVLVELSGAFAQRYIDNGLIRPVPQRIIDFVTDPANFAEVFANDASSGGTLYGMPIFRGQTALYYNTDMFAAAGLTEPPKTMEEYSQYADKLTQRDADGNPLVSGWSLRLSGGGSGISQKFEINLFQFGGRMLGQDEKGNWHAAYANEAGRKALKQYLENVHVLRTVTPEMPADTEAFERGQTAMYIRESSVIGDIAAKAPDLHYATAPLPRGSNVASVNLYFSSPDGAGEDAAWNFALAANEPENLLWLLDNVGWLPNRANVDYSPVVTAKPAFAAFVDLPEGYEFFSAPAIGPTEEISTRFAARLTEAFANASMATDDAAIDAFLAEAAEETNQILQRAGLQSN